MSNIVQLVDKLKDVILDVTDIKGKIEELTLLKDALYEDVEERLESVKELVKEGQDKFTLEIKEDFLSFKKEILEDRLKIREELEVVITALKDEIKGMSMDFEFETTQKVGTEGIKQILEKLKAEDPELFKVRAKVIAYMSEKLKGFEVEGESWYTLYKVLRSQL
jgi:hypothetical protein